MNIVDGHLEDKPTCGPNPNVPQCPPDHCKLRALVEKN